MEDDRIRGNDVGSNCVDRVGANPPLVVQDATSISLPAPASAVDHKDPFTSRSTVITANILTLWAYTLNWYAHAHGQPEYLPEWALGFVWTVFGMDIWSRFKSIPVKK